MREHHVPTSHQPPQADETLGQFMDYCTYGHMIDNVVLIVTGTLHERDVQVRREHEEGIYPGYLPGYMAGGGCLPPAAAQVALHCPCSPGSIGLRVCCISSRPHVQELLDKCHPLGMFDSIATLAVASNMRELYRLVLVDTPLAPYFSENITHEVCAGGRTGLGRCMACARGGGGEGAFLRKFPCSSCCASSD